MLEVTGLNAGYGRVPVLSGINLSVAAGEILLILGPNGAGKSTLLRSVCGFIKPAGGAIKLDGTDVTGWAPEAIPRRGMRLVLDGHRVFPTLSVRDNIRLGAAFRGGRPDFEAMAAP